MDNLRDLLGIRIDSVPNTWIGELCGVEKGEDKIINESILQ